MEYYMKLPRNKWEFLLFMAILSIVSVNIIGPTIACFENGFLGSTYLYFLTILPFIWFAVIAAVLITYKPASFLMSKVIKKEDSFKAHMLANTLCTVFLMSIFLTLVCPFIGSWSLTTDSFTEFFYRWPRNFAIALFVELIIAQPFARFCMLKFHCYRDKKAKP